MRFDNLREDVNHWGWMRCLFIRVMAQLRRYTGLRVYRVNLRPLVRHTPEPSLPGGITVRLVRPEELLRAADDPELQLHPDFVRGALARGDLAFGAFEGERLVGYTWRTFTAAPYFDGLWVRVGRPYQYTYNSFTRPSHRGKRIHAAITLFTDNHLLRRGYVAEVGCIDVTNFASLAVAKSLGRRRIGYAAQVKWFGRSIPFTTSAVRKIGIEFEFHPDRQQRPDRPAARESAVQWAGARPVPRTAVVTPNRIDFPFISRHWRQSPRRIGMVPMD